LDSGLLRTLYVDSVFVEGLLSFHSSNPLELSHVAILVFLSVAYPE